MDHASRMTLTIRPELNTSLCPTQSFKPGDTLRLKVVELAGDRALIDFGKFRATADIRVPVTLDEELTVRVLSSGKQLKLSVINRESVNPSSSASLGYRPETPADSSFAKIQADLKQILNHTLQTQTGQPSGQAVVDLLSRLNAYLESLDLKQVITKLATQLQSHLENSGIFFEHKLARTLAEFGENAQHTPLKKLLDLPAVKTVMTGDLKANLLILKNSVDNTELIQRFFSPKEAAILTKSIDTLLADIINQQGRAVKQLAGGEPFQVFSFTLPLKDGTQNPQLKVYYPKKQKAGSKDGFRISLLLEMDRLGAIRTDFVMLEKYLGINFFVKNPRIGQKIKANCQPLNELLNVFFDQIRLNVIVSEKKVLDFDRQEVQVTGDGRVDLRI